MESRTPCAARHCLGHTARPLSGVRANNRRNLRVVAAGGSQRPPEAAGVVQFDARKVSVVHCALVDVSRQRECCLEFLALWRHR
jgi:hypothetical protein